MVPGDWRSLLVEARESGVPFEAGKVLIGEVLVGEGNLVVAGAPVDMATLAAQVFGKGMGRMVGQKGKCREKGGFSEFVREAVHVRGCQDVIGSTRPQRLGSV